MSAEPWTRVIGQSLWNSDGQILLVLSRQPVLLNVSVPSVVPYIVVKDK